MPFRLFFVICLLVTLSNCQNCHKDIVDDICPQREGFDDDCEKHCQNFYPMRIGSGCFLRSSGALLSLFGIRSFQCKCLLPNHFCYPSQQGVNPFRQTFSLNTVSQHSDVQKLTEQPDCSKNMHSWSCDDRFDVTSCSWQRSGGSDWFEAREKGQKMSLSIGEKPDSSYLMAVGRSSIDVVTLSTCDGLCSDDVVNVTLRMWKAPWIHANLCFKEKDVLFCAPMEISNGQWLRETIPKTAHFQIYFKFTNVSEGDIIMLDDIHADFVSCHLGGDESQLHDNRIQTKALSARTLSVHPLRKIHSSSSVLSSTDRTCIGRSGLRRCRQKCAHQTSDEENMNARCLRQKDAPYTRRCVCHVRRSPRIQIDNDFQEKTTAVSVLDTSMSSLWSRETTEKVLNVVCGADKNNTDCDNQCKITDPESNGVCDYSSFVPECTCARCISLLCDFQKDNDCGWTDLRLISPQFSNISIAAKRDQANRYGLSNLKPNAYSGLLRRGTVKGPIEMSVDVYPSDSIDVRICVDSLSKCQTQTVEGRTWSRVAAKIKITSTEKIFLLFYNNSASKEKTLAVDNISLKTGHC